MIFHVFMTSIHVRAGLAPKKPASAKPGLIALPSSVIHVLKYP